MQEIDDSNAEPAEPEIVDTRLSYVAPTLTLLDISSTSHSANTVSDGTGNLIS